MIKLIIGVIIAAIILIVILQSIDPSIGGGTNPISEVYEMLTVSVSGEVVKPGTYIVELNSSLAALIDAASGVTSNADELAFDLSYLLENNQSFYIAPKYDMSDVCAIEPIDKVNINTDSKETLMTVNGFGAAISDAVIAYRAENAFKRIEDIKNVSGIGNATFEKIKNYITIRSA
ncbi:MAG: ComEA family DNA-binding protein [Bacilli bacterium]|jgi:competence protein ComEA